MDDSVVAEPVLPFTAGLPWRSISRDFTRSRHEEELLAQSYEQVCPWPSLSLRPVSLPTQQGAVA